ncbi:acetate--CoA ligase family protein [Prevotella communis]|uniref:acetate--CoA ligase family protein n=1 Tax=Prevotella communis TaxID=2913614 RepID=UPI001EDC3DE5|nr:acetate--CoA ligase family protein [Prevotella communis]UKK61859.1 acetate--CoA ligase family protein [Prevotella communis]UKK64686.1 acetate--CoA ligase family protein [Prevotella communis]
MINKQLLQPESIVVIGGSNNVHKPGGAVVRNLLSGGYEGTLRVVNPKEDEVQGIKAFHDAQELPPTDLAILVVAAKYCPDYVELLAKEKQVRAFIIISAGFSEETHEGALLEQRILDICDQYGCALIGPNCIGLLTRWHHSVFTRPIPNLNPKGVDFISGSGATAVFILESAVSKGLQFNSVWSIGNGKQNGIETVLEYMDEHFDAERDSLVKLLYIENIADPDKLLFHATSLIKKGCRIAAIKAGSSQAGSRAASSHTGAIASSDSAVEALFRKAGIVRCFSREELTTVGCILCLPPLPQREGGLNFAIVTHAGGPGVMLTDALSKGGMNVPPLTGPVAEELKGKLLPGSSVANPIDILATGTAEHLGIAIDYCERMDNIDAIMVIFGTPGLVKIFEVYDVLHKKIQECKKPIFPILPSVSTAGPEVQEFLKRGHVNFCDEVTLATALTQIMKTPAPAEQNVVVNGVDVPQIRRIIDSIQTHPQPLPEGRGEDSSSTEKTDDKTIYSPPSQGGAKGWVSPSIVHDLLAAAGIPTVPEFVSADKDEIVAFAERVGYPVVVKVVGPVHKSDVGGVTLNIHSQQVLSAEFDRMMQIPDATAVMVQKMIRGTELFIGAKYEPRFGHVVLCGLGGIFVEVLKDVSSGLAPLSYEEAYSMIRSLRGYKILKGTRGQRGINERKYAEIIVRLSTLLRFATEIKEMDINPLLADGDDIIAVDARILVEK